MPRTKYLPQKLLIVFNDMALGGVQHKILDVITYMNKFQPQTKITLCLYYPQGFFLKQVPQNIKIVSLPFHLKHLDFIWICAWTTFQISSINPTHILSYMDIGAIPTQISLLLLYWKKIHHVISEDILTSKYVLSDARPKLKTFLIQKLYPRAAKILVQTKIQKKDLQKIISQSHNDNVHISPNWLPQGYPPSHKIPSQRHYDILFIGRFETQKNPLEFINIIKKISSVKRHLHSIMIGSGSLKSQIINKIKTLNLQNNIKVIPPTLDPSKYYQNTKIFLSTSSYEGFPLTTLEAISCNCHPIAYSIPEIRQFFKHNPQLFLYQDSQSAVKLINKILKHPEYKTIEYYKKCISKFQYQYLTKYIHHIINLV
jgi:glycosyltransferase involved in cell wall biosynthesis